MSAADATAWALARPVGAFAARDFEDGRVLYDRESGSTRLLSPMAAFVLDQLAARSHHHGCSEDALLRDLMAGDDALLLQPAEFEAARGLLAEAMTQLAAAGLVTRLH